MAFENLVQADKSFDLDDFACPVCYELPVNEVFQCREGHLLCHECYSKVKKCPECRVPLPVKGIRVRAIEKILDNTPYKCPNRSVGCEVRVERKNLRSHVDNCAFKPVQMCRCLGILNCDFVPSSGATLVQHLKTTHNICTLTNDLNRIPFTDFVIDASGLAGSVYIYKDISEDKKEYLIYRKLDTSYNKDELTILCFDLGDSQECLEDHRIDVKFIYNYGKKQIELKNASPIPHYKDIESVINECRFPDAGFKIPLKFLKMQTQNPLSNRFGENVVEFKFTNLIYEQLNKTIASIDLTNSP